MSPKDVTGAEIDLDDAPARGADLFLVDGTNLAYRAFYALPEELSTSDGFPSGALLGFANMLFKLLADYKPRGVAVAWDTKPTSRTDLSADYKAHRKPMPELLREQFPHLRPIVEAFGYLNVEFEGWEADDVIATLATRADEAGIRTVVVSTDRDAFQLCSPNVALMMTPRGVSDVQVYTPERVLARYGVRPDQVPDYIGLKGDPSDNIEGVPGIGEKTASQLVAQFGSIEAMYERLGEVTGAKRVEALRTFEQQARDSKTLATMRRDLPLGVEPADLVSGSPDRSRLTEIFRRFEFRSLLGRVGELDSALPAADLPQLVGDRVPWREGELPAEVRGAVGLAVADGRFALADGASGVVVGAWEPAFATARVAGWAALGTQVAAHDAKPLRLTGPVAEDTLLSAYLVEPGRSEYVLDDLAREQGIEIALDPAEAPPLAEGAPAVADALALARRAELARRLAPVLAARVVERGSEPLYREIELPLTPVLAAMEDAGVRIDTYRMGEITARLQERLEELELQAHALAEEPFTLGSPQQVARILFEKLGLAAGRKGKTGYSTDARVLRGLREQSPIVPVIEEWRELSKLVGTYLLPLPNLISERDGRLHTTFNQAVAATGRLSTTNPNLQAIPIRTELGREIRSAFVADEGHVLVSADYSQVELRILAHVSGEPRLREAFARGEDVHAATAAEILGKPQEELTKEERNRAKAVNFGIIYGISAFGLADQLDIPIDEAKAYIDAYLARFPLVQDFIARTVEQAERDGFVTTLLGRRRAIPELRVQNRQTRALGERLAVNTVMQGTAADVIKVAMVRIARRLAAEGLRSRLVLQIHDELLVEAPDVERTAATAILREEMCGAYPLDPPLAVDVGSGDTWADAKG